MTKYKQTCCEKYINNSFFKYYYRLKGEFTCPTCNNIYYWRDRQWLLFFTYDEKGNAIKDKGL